MAIQTGTTFSHYRIESHLGSGALGEVYLAQDLKLERKVAIKFLLPKSDPDDHAKERFMREAQAAAALDHSNICAVHEIGEEGGQSFIVMQYVPGETLAARIVREPFPLDEALNVGVQIADALVEAHAHGVVHRDIKPHNIMITDQAVVKVLDFGLAKIAQIAHSEAETQSGMTDAGKVVGTVPYMSPEQLRGEQVDGRSDIFALGAVPYQLVTGRHPFAGGSAAATIAAIQKDDPPPLDRYTADAPPELERVVRKCLRKERAERYQSAGDLSVDLRSLREERQSGVAHEASDRSKKLRRIRLLALALFVLIILFYFLLRPAPISAIGSIVVLPFRIHGEIADIEYFSDGLTEGLIDSLSRLPKMKVINRTSSFRYKGREDEGSGMSIAGEVGARPE
jgi:eukaryotic-like serine/threonine-protein kinase